jgi:uncharacterized protein YraI
MSFKTRIASLIVLFSLLLSVAIVPASAAPAQQQAQFAAPVFVVNTSFLNIRSGPGVQYTVLVTVIGGTELPVLAVADDRVWYLVATPVGNGWANIQYVLPRGDFRNVPLLDPAVVGAPLVMPSTPLTIGLPNTAGQGGGGAPPGFVPMNRAATAPSVERFRATLNVASVNLRSQPNVNAPSIATLLQDETDDFAIVGSSKDRDGFDWYAIAVPDVGTGWVEGPKMRVRLSARYRSVVSITSDTIAMTVSPGGDSAGLPILSEGQEAFLLNLSRDGQHVQIELGDGKVGWVPFSAVVTRTGTPTDEPGIAYGTVGENGFVENPPQVGVVGQPVGVAGQGGGGPQLELPIAIVNTGNLNIRSGPGAQYTSVAVVPGGTQLVALGIFEDEVWFLVQGYFGQGWINREFVLFRGVLDYLPIIREEAIVSATVAQPVAYIGATVSLYGAPGTQFAVVGAVYGPVEVPVVARTADFGWIQVSTPSGFGWVPASQVAVRGDASIIPIIG